MPLTDDKPTGNKNEEMNIKHRDFLGKHFTPVCISKDFYGIEEMSEIQFKCYKNHLNFQISIQTNNVERIFLSFDYEPLFLLNVPRSFIKF